MKSRICFLFLGILVLWFALFQSILLIFKYTQDNIETPTKTAETKIQNFDTRPLLKLNDSPLVVQEERIMNISLVVGIPTVLRDDAAHYLIKTVNTILDDIPRFPGPNPVKKIVLLNAEDDDEDRKQLEFLVEKAFPNHVATKFIEIIHPPDDYYDRLADPCTLARNYNDTLARVLWRSKLALDGAYLMSYVKNMSADFYLHLEDDTPASKQKWLQEMFVWTETWEKNDTWGALKFSLGRPTKKRPNWDGMELPRKQFGGMIALLMKMSTVGGLSEHILEHFDRGPIDWEFGEYMIQIDKHVYGHNPSLFVHVGKLSTSKHVVEHEKKKKKNIKDTLLTWETCKNKQS